MYCDIFSFGDVYVKKRLRFETLSYCDVLTLCDVYVLTIISYVWKLLRFDTLTLIDATLCDIYVVLCYVLSQYRTCTSLAQPSVSCFQSVSNEGKKCFTLYFSNLNASSLSTCTLVRNYFCLFQGVLGFLEGNSRFLYRIICLLLVVLNTQPAYSEPTFLGP